MDIVKRTIETYDTLGSRYCEKTRQEKFLKWEERFIRKLLSFMPRPNPLVLDMGCADGRHCAIIDQHGGKAVGADLSAVMLDEARKHYPGGSYGRMDMRRLPLRDAVFDGIWSSGSIYHVTKSDVPRVIDEFARILKPGGIVTVNFKLGSGEQMEENPRSYGGSPRFYAYYTEEEMTGLFENAGFSELERTRYPEEIYGDIIPQMWFQLPDQGKGGIQ